MRTRIACCVTLLAASIGATVGADVRTIGGDGVVHRVEVVSWSVAGRTQGTALRHSWQDTDGTWRSAIVPGTDDDVVDRQPAIDVDPATNALILVWSRNEPAGSRIFWSRFAASRWSLAGPLQVSATVDAVAPDVHVASKLTHVLWRETSAPPTVVKRASFYRDTMGLAYGPESLDAKDAPFAGSSSAASSEAPNPGDTFFTLAIPGILPGERGRVVVWGVRDEPVPVGSRQAFPLVGELTSVSDVSAQTIADDVVLWYVASDRLVYSVRPPSGEWSEQKVVNLTDGLSASEAKLRLTQILLRSRDVAP